MNNIKVEEIIELDNEIRDMFFKTTSYFSPNEIQKLNIYDEEALEHYQRILDLIIEIANEEKTNHIKIIDEKFFKIENTASMMIESYIETLQFYGNIDRNVTKTEIKVIKQIQENLKLDEEFERKNIVELADCYFHIGNEEKARKLILEFLKNNSDADEPYQCMQNWYMYDKPDINKLAEVIDLAEKNNHILFTDFGYDSLVNYYKDIKDNKNYKKYQELYDKWKESRETISLKK